MKVNEIRQFVDVLFSQQWEGTLRIDSLIINIIENSSIYSDSQKEKYIDSLGDPLARSFHTLIREVERKIEQNIDCPVVSLTDESDGYFVEKILGDHDGLYLDAIERIESYEKFGKNKGLWFERFCIAFLKDFGVSCKSTNGSNDKGIDIFGSYRTSLNCNIGKLILNEDIYILGQAKYFSEKVDTPVIRKLVGDTIFVRFDELEYVEIKHNAVHLMVFSRNGFTGPALDFAKKNKIELFDKSRIAHLIANNPNLKWSCLDVGN